MSPERLDQIQDLYLAALDLPPAERPAFLDAACADDPALRREVDSLLDVDVEADSFLERPLVYVHALDEAATLPAEQQRIGPYRVLRELGRGGMGTVYLAERADGQFEQQVALKVVRYGFGSEELTQRFLRERQILARLQHPQIAQLLDGGVAEDGRPYFAMEYVEGEPLTDYCDRRRLSIAARLRLFAQVGEAVQDAHRNLVVHRDLKPTNILVDAQGRVKLLDFGIAKVLEDEAPDGLLTQTGARVMTPEYAAPEQVTGAVVTTATDIYALGVVLYELLTGHRPYRFERATPSAIEQVILATEPVPPSTVVARREERRRPDGTTETITPEAVSQARASQPVRLKRLLAGDLDVITLKALRKEPERRYPSAEAFMADVRRYLGGLPVEARPPTLGYRLRKFVGRHRVSVLAAGVVLCSLVGGLTVAIWQARVASAERDRARVEVTKATAIKDFLVSVFEVSDPGESRGASVTALELLSKGATRIEAELHEQPEIRAEMMEVMGEVYLQLGLFDKAADLTRASLALRRTLYGERHPEVAASQSQLALIYYEKGQLDEAIALLRRALAIHRAQPAPSAAAIARLQYRLGILLNENGAYAQADTLLRTALVTYEHLDAPTDHAEALNAFALLQMEQGHMDIAEVLFQEAIALQRTHFDEEHPARLETTHNLAQLYWNQNKLGAAEPLFRDVLALDRIIFGDDHSDVALDLNNLGLVLMDKGDFGEAEAAFREALDIQQQRLGRMHPDVSATLYNLATLHWLREELQTAETLFRDALAIDRHLYDDDHPNVGIDLTRLAAVLRDRGDLPQAAELLAQALTIFRAAFPEDHPRIASVKIRQGRIAFDQGRFDEAEALLREGIAQVRNVWADDYWKTAEAQSVLGQCLLARGADGEAASLLRASLPVLQKILGPQHALTRQTRTALSRTEAGQGTSG